MPEPEPGLIIPRREDILTSREAVLLQQAGRGELLCPGCSQPLQGQKIVSPMYEGIVLYCPDRGRQGCEYREY